MNVSIIIPAYNVEKYLEECVHSAMAQTYDGVKEIIIVDNNSTDNTLQIAEKLKAKHSEKIKVLQQKKQGANAARNMGLKNSTGEWIQFLDADDLLLPGKIKHQVDILKEKKDKEPSFIISATIKAAHHKIYRTNVKEDNPFFNLLLSGEGRAGNTCANLWNKEILKTISGFDETLPSSQEIDLMFRMLLVNPVVLYDYRSNSIIRQRDDDTQISNNKNYSKNKTQAFRVKKEIIKHISQNNPEFFKERKHEVKKLYQYFLYHLLKIKNDLNIETLAFLNKYMYEPWYLKGFKNKKLRYWVEKRIAKMKA